MKRNTEIIDTICGELKISDITKLELGISNRNYLLDDSYVLKISFDDSYPLNDDIILHKSAFEKGIGVGFDYDYFTTKYHLSQYQKSLHSIPLNELDELELKKIVVAVKTFNALPHANMQTLTKHQLLQSYAQKAGEEADFPYDLIEPEKSLMVHLDLICSNILFDEKGEVKLIDYDLSILGDPLLDLASLLFENNLDDYHHKALISCYFSDDKKLEEYFTRYLPLYNYFMDSLWYYWAKARLKKAPKDKAPQLKAIMLEKRMGMARFKN